MHHTFFDMQETRSFKKMVLNWKEFLNVDTSELLKNNYQIRF